MLALSITTIVIMQNQLNDADKTLKHSHHLCLIKAVALIYICRVDDQHLGSDEMVVYTLVSDPSTVNKNICR